MSFWSNPIGSIEGEVSHITKSFGGEISHITKSVEGETHHIVKDVGGELSKARSGLGHFYAYVARPAIPILATIGATVIPGLQPALPYLLSYDVGDYGHTIATGGIGSIEKANNIGNIEAGIITAGAYGIGSVINTALESGVLNNNIGGIGGVYHDILKVGGDASMVLGGAEAGLGLYNDIRKVGHQPTVNILGQEQNPYPIDRFENYQTKKQNDSIAGPATGPGKGGGVGIGGNHSINKMWEILAIIATGAIIIGE